MKMITITLLSIGFVAVAVLLLAIKNITSKMITGQSEVFPDTSIGGNKKLKKAGIYCPKTLDAIERKKVKDEILASSCESCSSNTKK